MSPKLTPRVVRSERETIRACIAEILDREFASQERCFSPFRADYIASLRALDLNAITATEANAALGARLVHPANCAQCRAETWELVYIGHPDQPSDVCRACLIDALRVLDAAYPPKVTT